MSEISLKGFALKDEKPNKVRRDGFLPSNLYGNGLKNKKFKIKMNEFIKAYNITGESTLLNLQIDNNDVVTCLIKEVQKDVITGDFLHVDFYQVKMGEKITAEIPLVIVGESSAVKNLGGILNIELSSIEVECLPSDLKSEIEVDISILKTLEDYIRVEDIKLPNGVVCISDLQNIVISVGVAKREKEEVVTDENLTPNDNENENKEDEKSKKKEEIITEK